MSLLLLGCSNKELTYSYLMKHPEVLKLEITDCQSIDTMKENAKCPIILQAAKDFSELLEEQGTDPEKFGQKIIEMEMQQSKTPSKEQKEQIEIALAVVGFNSPE